MTLSERLSLDSPKQMSAFAFQDRLMLYSANRPTQTAQLALIDLEALATGRTPFVALTVPASTPAPSGSSGPQATGKP